MKITDKAAEICFQKILENPDRNLLFIYSRYKLICKRNFLLKVPQKVRHQYEDNLKWIKEAFSYNLVVGSKARILYSDQNGRAAISLAINKLVREKVLKAPVIISRDHHDVSGTDSPFRETSNVYDGSAFTADMAVQ